LRANYTCGVVFCPFALATPIPALLEDLKNSLISAEELAYELVDVVKIFGRKILDFVSVDTLLVC